MPEKRARSPQRAKTQVVAADASELRDRILRASIELIEDEGLAKLSMREVARRAGVTHQAPYHHFADREQILGEIAEQGFHLLSERLSAAALPRDVQRDNCVTLLRALGEAYVQFAVSHPAHFRIMFRPELVDMDNCPGAKQAGHACFSNVRDVVHAAVQAGLPAVPNEDALVALMWSLVHGLACLLLDGPLAMKMPDTARDVQIRGVMQGFAALLQASLGQKAPRRSR
ncbi:MAG TPA: TetR/AcrR family transcriptional regulator [Polyangiales bacterium]|nr:TetR/AcrR family transcriptional regulator [Polyangiales bacterium]